MTWDILELKAGIGMRVDPIIICRRQNTDIFANLLHFTGYKFPLSAETSKNIWYKQGSCYFAEVKPFGDCRNRLSNFVILVEFDLENVKIY